MARRVKSLMHGDAKDKPVVWHREHRSKKGRNNRHHSIKRPIEKLRGGKKGWKNQIET